MSNIVIVEDARLQARRVALDLIELTKLGLASKAPVTLHDPVKQ